MSCLYLIVHTKMFFCENMFIYLSTVFRVSVSRVYLMLSAGGDGSKCATTHGVQSCLDIRRWSRLRSNNNTTPGQARNTSQLACQSSQTWQDHSGTQTKISPELRRIHRFGSSRALVFVVDMIQKKVTIFTFIKLLALPQHQWSNLYLLECKSLVDLNSVAYWASNLFSLHLIFGWKTQNLLNDI